MNPFVRAVWSDLLIVTYAVPDAALEPFLTPGLTLDWYAGRAHISLVAFRFRQTRVLGLPAPFGDFPQWNLRCYVAPGSDTDAPRGNERGIVFLQEFVPSPVIATTVRALYNEPYRTAPLTCRVTTVGPLRRVRYDLSVAGRTHALAASAWGPPFVPPVGSAEEFFTGQGWGRGRSRWGRPTGFHVTHPPWRVYAVREPYLSVDFERLYGPRWAFLGDESPRSVILCEGSAVGVSQSLPRKAAP